LAKKPTGAGEKGKRGQSESRIKERLMEERAKEVRPMLISLIDTFIILVVFLFMNYSAEGDIMTVAPDLKLPASESTKNPVQSVNVAVTNKHILVEGAAVCTAEEALADTDLVIDNLLVEMTRIRKIKEILAEQDPTRPFKGEVTIQGDKLISFDLLTRVMYTCGRAKYGNIALAVLRKS
jgi:biopolymer transport protein ExbD